jgi:glycosyltransferase involved in cell wall biosynthesis
MAKKGHDVYVVCGCYEIGGLAPLPWYQLFRQEEMAGFKVIILNAFYSNHFGILRRAFVFCWFAFLATFAALAIRKPDLIFATSTPLTVGVPGYIAAKLKRVPFVFEVRDIWPDCFIQSGTVTGKELSIRLLTWLEKFIYKHAAKILLVSHGFEKRLIERGFPPEKMKTILLGADGNIFRDVKPNYEFLDRYELRNKIIAVYTGAHGITNRLEYVIEAAECTKDRTDIAFLLIGGGSEKNKLKELAKEKAMKNIVFADPVSKAQLPRILAVCHIGLVIFNYGGKPRPLTPNKIFDYMFSGLPLVLNYEGSTIELVRADNSGILVHPTNSEDLAEKVKMLADNPQLREELGQNGRQAAQKKYDRKIIADQLIGTFEEVIASYRKK